MREMPAAEVLYGMATPILATRDRGGGKAVTGNPTENQTVLFPSEKMRHFAEPVLISACLLGIPCRWHGRRAGRRDELLARLKQRYVLVPVCPEQLGGMSTPRTSERLSGATGSDILAGRARLIAPETGEDMTRFHLAGARYTLEIAELVGARRAYLLTGSPSCDREGVTGEMLRRAGIEVIRV